MIYSYRNAMIGSIVLALLAGRNPAPAATAARMARAANAVQMSVGFTL
jgi:hypothetical protein